MKIDHPNLSAPIYLKLSEDQEWPADKMFYLMTKDGMFLCRNNTFFRSSAKTDKLPKGLASHKAKMTLDFPLISQQQFEQIVGFFDAIWKLHNSEAAVLLIWNVDTEQVEILCPPQEATVGSAYTDWKGKEKKGSPMDVKYEIPTMPANKMVFGDVHSHVEMSAYASGMDTADEKTKPGVHIVIGKIHQEPPDIHIESTADGCRFSIDELEHVVEKYDARRADFPPEWIDQVKIKTWKSNYSSTPRDDEEWVAGYHDETTGKWVHGEWVKKTGAKKKEKGDANKGSGDWRSDMSAPGPDGWYRTTSGKWVKELNGHYDEASKKWVYEGTKDHKEQSKENKKKGWRLPWKKSH